MRTQPSVKPVAPMVVRGHLLLSRPCIVCGAPGECWRRGLVLCRECREASRPHLPFDVFDVYDDLGEVD